MLLTIRSLNGDQMTISANPSQTIGEICDQLVDFFNVPSDDIKLIYAGMSLARGQTLENYNISEERIMHAVFRLREGESGTEH